MASVKESERAARSQERLERAAREGSLEQLRQAAAEGDPKAKGSLCLSLAAARGDGAELVKFLIPLSDLAAGGARALRCALASGEDQSALALCSAPMALEDREALLLMAAGRGRLSAALALMEGVEKSFWPRAIQSARAARFDSVASQMEARALEAEARAAGPGSRAPGL